MELSKKWYNLARNTAPSLESLTRSLTEVEKQWRNWKTWPELDYHFDNKQYSSGNENIWNHKKKTEHGKF